MAQKYLGIVASSLPSERLFSTAGNLLNAKRAALSPENVSKLVFLHETLPPIYLQYQKLLSKCQCESAKIYVKSLNCMSCIHYFTSVGVLTVY